MTLSDDDVTADADADAYTFADTYTSADTDADGDADADADVSGVHTRSKAFSEEETSNQPCHQVV